MLAKFKEKRAFFDYGLIFTMLILMAISTVMVSSARVWNGGDYANTSFFEKQLMFDAMAIVLFLLVSQVNHEVFRGPVIRLLWYSITWLMLMATLFSAPLNGARALLNFGIFLIQPIELCKFVLVGGLFPGTGVTFPFISYGGSSLLVMSTMLGVMANISMQNKYRVAYHKEVQTARSMSDTSSLSKGGASVD
jgi:cell division protein FtsW (lipid II flippase)